MPRCKKILTAVLTEDEALNWEYVLDEYLDFLSGCGRSESTVKIYRDQVSRFYRSKNPVWDSEKESFFEWNGEPQIHTNHRLDSCKRFWEWAAKAGYRRSNPAKDALRRRMDKISSANVDLSDIEKLVGIFRAEHREHPRQWDKLRNYAYIMFAVGTGVRPGEGLKLRRDDFNMAGRFVLARGEFVKTRQSRIIYIPQDMALIRMLQKMIRIQAKNGLHGNTPLFSDSAGKEINARAWFHIVQKRAKTIGVRIKPYDFRHAFITHSLSEGANPYDLRDQVGHSSMEMMKRYYHSNPDARRKTANLSPLRKIS
jgi:integrase